MAREKIIVVEDDEDILELIAYNLGREGYQVTKVTSGEKLLQLVQTRQPDLIILDLMLPGVDGLQICKRLKAEPRTQRIPVVMVTARGEEADVVSGLELGADDYIPKPFRPRELVARVRAVLRRSGAPAADPATVTTIHDLTIDPRRREVKVAGKVVGLTFTEFELLHFLARNPGLVFTRYQIVDAVRGDNYSVTDRSVDVQVVGLRRRLGKAGRHIETVRGVGYRFQEEPK
jgi:two-component system phosphate regulon response regulator PhoB